MFQIVQLQVSIAREHALKSADDGGQHVATVVLRCLEELRGCAKISGKGVIMYGRRVDICR